MTVCGGQVARGLSRGNHGAKSLCEEHGIMPFRWPRLFRNLVVRLRLSWEERVECKLTSQAMKRYDRSTAVFQVRRSTDLTLIKSRSLGVI